MEPISLPRHPTFPQLSPEQESALRSACRDERAARSAAIEASIADVLARLTSASPDVPCVYVLKQGDEVVYVGQTVNLSGRISSHRCTKAFDSCQWAPVPREDLNRVEAALIEHFNPRLNKQGAPR
jgi:hypothetical protein